MKAVEISVIGVGALGSALVRALSYSGYQLRSIFNRTADKADVLAGELGIPLSGSFPRESNEIGNLILLTVSDGAIDGVVRKLETVSDDFKGSTVVHCSGTESSEMLKPLSEKGASVAALHPLQSFTRNSGPSDFRGIYFSMEGDRDSIIILEEICNQLGAKSFTITPEDKKLLHAAAVFASNYLVALTAAAAEVGSLGGLSEDQCLRSLLPLMQTTLDNITRLPVTHALSGPVARGDVKTVQKHLEILQSEGELLTIYKLLGRKALALAEQRGSLDSDSSDILKSLLK